MNINKYIDRQLIGWLSYNPNYEARDVYNQDNKVCYIYPRFLTLNNQYIPIDSKVDFPTVGRIAIRIMGQESASDVFDRYGSFVSFRIKGEIAANHEAKNFYTLRYNYQLGRDRSDVWIDKVDANLFFEVLTTTRTTQEILRTLELDAPYNLNNFYSNSILINSNGNILGPFDYEIDHTTYTIKLKGLERYDYKIANKSAGIIRNQTLIMHDHNDTPVLELVSANSFGDPRDFINQLDTIDDVNLVDIFLDKAKLQLSYSRNEFREIKDFCLRLATNKEKVDLSEERIVRLQELLPKLFENKTVYGDILSIIIQDQFLRQKLSTYLIQDGLNKVVEQLDTSNAISVHKLIESLNTLKEDPFKFIASLGVKVQKVSNKPRNSSLDPKEITNEDQFEEYLHETQLTGVAVPEIFKDIINLHKLREQAKAAVLQTQVLQQTKATQNSNAGTNQDTQDSNSLPLLANDGVSVSSIIPFNIGFKKLVKHIKKESADLLNTLSNINSSIDEYTGLDSIAILIYQKPELNPAYIKNTLKIANVFTKTIDALIIILENRLQELDISPQEQSETNDYVKRLKKILNELNSACSQIETSSFYKDLQNYKATSSETITHVLAHQKYETNNQDEQNSSEILELQKQNQHLVDEIEELRQKDQILNDIEEISTQLDDLLEEKSSYEQECAQLKEQLNELKAQQINTLATPLASENTNSNSVLATVLQLLQANGLNTNLNELALANSSLVLSNQQSNLDASVALNRNVSVDTNNTAVDTHESKQLIPIFDQSYLQQDSTKFNASNIIQSVQSFILEQGGRQINYNDIANYLICISQGFITTFAGEPGTGKTSLCNLLAHSLGLVRNDQNNRFTEVSVERGWTSLKDFIGYYNPLTKRMEKSNADIFDAFLELNKEAQFAPDGQEYNKSKIAPYFILLDEANLSPIEHYWAAFFRTCDASNMSQRTISLGGKANWYVPEHLRFLATVNFDHTTEELSARFLDRSWVITLEPTKIQLDSSENYTKEQEPKMFSFETLMNAFAPQKADTLSPLLLKKWQNIQNIFAHDDVALPIRPRNLKMVHNYCLVASKCMDQSQTESNLAPLDYAVAQKILPTINGSGDRYHYLIEALVKECDEQRMPLCAKHLKRIQRNGGADLGFYQFFAR